MKTDLVSHLLDQLDDQYDKKKISFCKWLLGSFLVPIVYGEIKRPSFREAGSIFLILALASTVLVYVVGLDRFIPADRSVLISTSGSL